VGSFGISPSGRFVVGHSVVDWPLGRPSEAGVSSGAFSTCWSVVGPSAVCRSPAWTSVVGWSSEGLFNCGRVVEGSFASGVSERASPAGEAIVRSSAGFGSSDRPSVLGGPSERLNCGRVAEGSFAGRVSERPSPAGEAIVVG
jgi:hypothetical protein